MDIGERTSKFLHKPYSNGNGNLEIGDKVIVHPSDERPDGGKSIAREPYDGVVVEEIVPWVNGARNEICVRHEWGCAVMNDYLFGRLEKSL